MTHPHAPPEASPEDGPFLRILGLSFALLAGGVAALVIMADPLGRFGTGLVPPILTRDRDQKAALLNRMEPGPALVVLGSSRSKTIDPACLARLTGLRSFNFAVDGAGPQDLVATLRYLLSRRPATVRELWIGLDPEMLRRRDEYRALLASRVLAPFAPGHEARRGSLAADLFGSQSVLAALRALTLRSEPDTSLTLRALDPDGRQRYPRWEAAREAGTAPQDRRVRESIPGILSQYQSFASLDPTAEQLVRRVAEEARQDGIGVTVFIPPIHPALTRALDSVARTRIEEAVGWLDGLAGEGLIRFADTRALDSVAGDSTDFIDAIHFLGSVADRTAEHVAGRPGACAVQ